MKLDQPAMPVTLMNAAGPMADTFPGFTKREYAAIHLCVPDSGNDELDAMIRRAQRERLAGQVLAELINMHQNKNGFWCDASVALSAYIVADAVIAAAEIVKEKT